MDNKSFKIINYLNGALEKSNNYRYNISFSFNKVKLFWKNQTYNNIGKIVEEINLFKNHMISFKNKHDFIKRKNPKISLVITLHNQRNYLLSIYSSIQYQELKDIEIIFVDDASIDNTSIIIKQLMEKDKRIIYLKNNRTRRAFYSRKKGILKAKGEYILCIDPDDLIINNILIKAYETAKQYDLDIVQFYALRGYIEAPTLWNQTKYKDGILKTNKEIRNNFYHSKSRNLWDKLVRKSIYLKSINFMDKQFENQIYYVNNDDTAFFGLLHVARTYGFLEQIGYFYIIRPHGTYYYRNDPKNMNKIFLSIANNMKYFYIQSDNNTLEKCKLAYNYFEKSMYYFGNYISFVDKELNYILDVFDLYLNSTYFNETQKKQLFYYKSKFIPKKKKRHFNLHNILKFFKLFN